MENIKRFILIGIVIGFLSSCSAGYHLRRAIKKDPGIFDTLTVTQVDTVLLPPLEKVVTRVELVTGNDSIIYVDKQGIIIKIIKRGLWADIEVLCPPPPKLIIKTVQNYVHIKEPPTLKQKWKIWWAITRWILMAIGLASIGFLIYRVSSGKGIPSLVEILIKYLRR